MLYKVCMIRYPIPHLTSVPTRSVVKVGLLSKDNVEEASFAYRLYKADGNECIAQGFKETFSRNVPIDFLGVW